MATHLHLSGPPPGISSIGNSREDGQQKGGGAFETPHSELACPYPLGHLTPSGRRRGRAQCRWGFCVGVWLRWSLCGLPPQPIGTPRQTNSEGNSEGVRPRTLGGMGRRPSERGQRVPLPLRPRARPAARAVLRQRRPQRGRVLPPARWCWCWWCCWQQYGSRPAQFCGNGSGRKQIKQSVCTAPAAQLAGLGGGGWSYPLRR